MKKISGVSSILLFLAACICYLSCGSEGSASSIYVFTASIIAGITFIVLCGHFFRTSYFIWFIVSLLLFPLSIGIPAIANIGLIASSLLPVIIYSLYTFRKKMYVRPDLWKWLLVASACLIHGATWLILPIYWILLPLFFFYLLIAELFVITWFGTTGRERA